ncbi:MAG: glycosyltransferase family 4 protein [Acidimicrobiales bacterium]
MRVHVVSLVFPPEPVTSARVASDVADALVDRGHDVTVFCPFPNRPHGRLRPPVRRRLAQSGDVDGYRVTRTWHTLSRSSTLLSRGFENVSFGITSSIAVLRAPRADVAYVSNWPLIAQLLNAVVLRLKRTPVVLVVKDLYPETLISRDAGKVSRAVERLLIRLDATVCGMSAKITTISERQRSAVVASRAVRPDDVVHIPDWFEHVEIDEAQADRFRRDHGLDDSIVALYAGSITRAAGLDALVDAARELRDRPDLRVVLVGDGVDRVRLEALRDEHGLERLKFVHPLRPEEVAAVHEAADMLIVSLAPGVARHAVPSKMISYLFAGKPVIASVDGDSGAADFARTTGCGVVTPAGDGAELAAAIASLADDPERRRSLGNAALAASEDFESDVLVDRVCALLEAAASSLAKM